MISKVYCLLMRGPFRRTVGRLLHFLRAEKYDFTQALEYTKLKVIFDQCENKTLIDIGANDGKTFSNSYPLLKRGWEHQKLLFLVNRGYVLIGRTGCNEIYINNSKLAYNAIVQKKNLLNIVSNL